MLLTPFANCVFFFNLSIHFLLSRSLSFPGSGLCLWPCCRLWGTPGSPMVGIAWVVVCFHLYASRQAGGFSEFGLGLFHLRSTVALSFLAARGGPSLPAAFRDPPGRPLCCRACTHGTRWCQVIFDSGSDFSPVFWESPTLTCIVFLQHTTDRIPIQVTFYTLSFSHFILTPSQLIIHFGP